MTEREVIAALVKKAAPSNGDYFSVFVDPYVAVIEPGLVYWTVASNGQLTVEYRKGARGGEVG